MPNDDIWRAWINNLPGGDLPDDGIVSPDLERTPKIKAKGIKSPKDKLFVQEIVTTMIVYTDMQGRAFGQQGFQQMFILGEMTGDKLLKLLESKARKTQSGE